MPTYFIGDLQGCFDALQALLERIAFDRALDRLCFTGDLVNRGGQDLQTLRFLVGHAEAVEAVLGNHDLHLLAAAEGLRELRAQDTFGEVLEAPEAEDLLHWLRHRPLLHQEGGRVLIHAGLLPDWNLSEAKTLARSLELRIRSGELEALLAGPPPCDPWSEITAPRARLRLALDAFVSLRFVDPRGRSVRDVTLAPENAPPGLVPWFAAPGRRSQRVPLVHGHWAALGVRQEEMLWAIDGGCVWGGTLCAIRAEDGARFEVKRPEQTRR